MKTVKDLRKFDLKINSNNLYFSRLKDLHRKNIDLDVYLPTKKTNLQRELVWTIEQKRELIWSILIERSIPHISVMSIIDDEKSGVGDDIIQIIDGKQRLSSMIDFIADKFTIILEGKEYLYSELPEDYQRVIGGYEIMCVMVYDQFERRIVDTDKIEWFKRINYFGTPQEMSHLETLK